MQRQQAKHICFYSNKDQWSKAFLEELGKTPWVSEFQFVCVDPGQNRPSLPKWLKQVPTLVISGKPEPLIDAEVMNWLFSRKMEEQPRQEQKGSTGGGAVPASMGGEPMSWNNAEMGGFGDAGYSYLDADTSTQGNGGSTIPGNFTFLNGASAPGDRQSQNVVGGMSQSSGRSKKEQQFDAQMEMYMRQRDSGVPRQVKRE